VKTAAGPIGFDIFGDIHGCHDALVRLLERLGYRENDGAYGHSKRQAIFLGDLIDRGPKIRETLHLVRAMELAGNARVIIGNHEFNAIWQKNKLDQYLRSGDSDILHPRLYKLMQATLEQFRDYPEEWQEFTQWFESLALFWEGEGFRAVHACWDAELIQQYQQRYHTSYLTEEFLLAAQKKESLEHRVVDRLTRGTSMALPKGLKLKSKDGFIRRFFRTKFWSESPKTYGDVVFQPDPLPYDLAEHPIAVDDKSSLVHYDPNDPPVFFGHYWLKGRPKPLLHNVACLDYSAVNFGRLTAYCFDGETSLKEDNFKWVYVDPNNNDADLLDVE
jgi:hypothetical protein